jgi:peptidoglycan/LPS O-acetylase OafA/YrhL
VKWEESGPTGAYRPDIDGLRAVAILAVVFYHYGFWQFPGGFVGVDVFFVISGFLITRLIAGAMARDRFSLREFYERRIRRIFPALFVMLLFASSAAAILLFPGDLQAYARSLIATAAFAANFEFWREAGYFDQASAQKPLLHLWSIAIEEQFYLLFPALMLFCRSRRLLKWAVSVLFVFSLGYAIWSVGTTPVAAFYLLPSRAWELLLGAGLALGIVPAIRRQEVAEIVGVAGVALIGASVGLLQAWRPFPGLAALPPCLGAACIIHAGAMPTWITRLLSLKPIVFVGLISYSLYLWHWPVMVYARNLLSGDPNPIQTSALIALSLVLAVLSWRYVEKPIRRAASIDWRHLFAGAGSAVTLTAGLGIAVASANGLPERWRPEIRRILAEETNHEPRMDTCFGLSADDVRSGRICRFGSAGAMVPTFLLWGDSHADAILPAVQQVAEERGRAGLFAGSGSCAPLLGVTRSDAVDCKAFNDAVMAVALKREVKEVILDARWSKNADQPAAANASEIVLSDAVGSSYDRASRDAVFSRGLERLVATLRAAGKQVVIVAPVPESAYSVPRKLARLRLSGDKRVLARPLSSFLQRQGFVLSAIEKMRLRYRVRVIYPHQILCGTGVCRFALNDRPLYRDEHHLSVFGAMQLTPLVSRAF